LSALENFLMTEAQSVNLLDFVRGSVPEQILSLVRLGRDETPIVPFTLESVPLGVH
jgi:hypothetical protein